MKALWISNVESRLPIRTTRSKRSSGLCRGSNHNFWPVHGLGVNVKPHRKWTQLTIHSLSDATLLPLTAVKKCYTDWLTAVKKCDNPKQWCIDQLPFADYCQLIELTSCQTIHVHEPHRHHFLVAWPGAMQTLKSLSDAKLKGCCFTNKQGCLKLDSGEIVDYF